MTSALIIGASRGIGKEFVTQLLNSEWTVYACARDLKDIDLLEQQGAKGILLDVTDPTSIVGLGRSLEVVDLDLVIYVAGIYGPEFGSRLVPSAAEFDKVMHTNVLGAMQSIALLAPMLEITKGKFIFISSLMGSISATQSSFGWIYRASKAALNMSVKAASMDYPRVTFSVMNPGWVKTDMGGESAPTSVDQSVKGMLSVISKLSLNDSGSFQSFDERSMNW
jgi:NAD(P)-dependent dehydrogenase (short-subunit alcohol dehydrogenase family)